METWDSIIEDYIQHCVLPSHLDKEKFNNKQRAYDNHARMMLELIPLIRDLSEFKELEFYTSHFDLCFFVVDKGSFYIFGNLDGTYTIAQRALIESERHKVIATVDNVVETLLDFIKNM